MFPLILIALTSCAQTSPAQGPDSPRFKPASFQLYYGSEANLVDSMIEQIGPRQIVVVEVRGLSALQFGRVRRAAIEKNAKVLAYISIGELHQRELGLFERFLRRRDASADFEKVKSEVLIGANEQFDSLHTDALSDHWRAFVLDKIADIYAIEVDGLFLDTVDTSDLYIEKQEWKIDRRAKSIAAMIALVRKIKSVDREKYIMQNRGLNIIGKQIFVGNKTGKLFPGMSLDESHEDNPDAILFENAFSSLDEWATARLSELDATQKAGSTTVVALGYADVIGDRGAFLKKCEKHEFIPSWASNSHDLHEEIAR